MNYVIRTSSGELYHHGILGQKWGVRRFQNPDGSLTFAGKRHVRQKMKEIASEQNKVRRYQYKAIKEKDPYKKFLYEWNLQFGAEIKVQELLTEFENEFGDKKVSEFYKDPKYNKYFRDGERFYKKSLKIIESRKNVKKNE